MPTPTDTDFPGFSHAALQFLVDLAANNKRGWFQPRKADYERLLKEPLEAEFKDGRLRDINVPYPVEPSDYYRFLYSFIHRKQSIGTARINSGIQVIGERLLTSTFRSALLELAASKPYPNEQSVMTAFFKKHRNYTTEFASPVYNFKSSFLDRMPVVQGMEREGTPYSGFLYAGLMIKPDGTAKVLEFNCRMGDPETQPIMMRLKSDLFPIVEHYRGVDLK